MSQVWGGVIAVIGAAFATSFVIMVLLSRVGDGPIDDTGRMMVILISLAAGMMVSIIGAAGLIADVIRNRRS